ncbi:ribosomal protein S18-alanine N-acetyltransferase [Periweissella fabaria]|uniref:N-acetyltransferase domain-containing protein n=1 Tax=Periweissella fabaria TaxID=546157 RepID=A0ABN8BL18_9LACO|nr:ribosomal protein S18-alanine N-acetyltransferase [Periweissella fabaria]MCM0597712.1 ribosomal protein S18-alanine N-acetyltransferase [Periweissella fabaria]CAH0417161.1 hypothetical protein WFA24289_01489 [Periweissella fabaria]
MLKKLTKEQLHKKFKQLFNSIVGVDEQQQAALAMKAYQVNINEVKYYVGRAQVSDIDEILDIERAVYDGATPWNKQAFTSELHRKHDRLYLVIRKNDQLLAFIGSSYSRATQDMHITNVAVLPAWQRRGIGSFLLNVIIDKARQINAQQVSLEVRVSNTQAQRVYHELGFESQGISAGYYFGDHEDALKMALIFNEEEK